MELLNNTLQGHSFKKVFGVTILAISLLASIATAASPDGRFTIQFMGDGSAHVTDTIDGSLIIYGLTGGWYHYCYVWGQDDTLYLADFYGCVDWFKPLTDPRSAFTHVSGFIGLPNYGTTSDPYAYGNYRGIALSPDESRIYTTSIGNFYACDIASESLIKQKALYAENVANEILVSSDGSKIYLMYGSAIGYVVDATTFEVTPYITWNPPADIIYGTPLTSTQLNPSTKVKGTFSYNPLSGTVLPAGTNTLSATFTPTGPTSCESTTTSVQINVLKATPTITWTPNPATIVYNTGLVADQLDAVASFNGEPVNGNFVYDQKVGDILKMGTQTLTAKFISSDPNINDKTASTTITVLTPVQAAQQILKNVQVLVNSGKLNKEQSNSLIVKLNNALKYLNAGNTKKATNELSAFVNDVNSDITNKVLLPADGQSLIDEANAIINALK